MVILAQVRRQTGRESALLTFRTHNRCPSRPEPFSAGGLCGLPTPNDGSDTASCFKTHAIERFAGREVGLAVGGKASEFLRTTKFPDLIAVLRKTITRLPAEHVYARPTSHPFYQIVKLVRLAAVLAAWSIKANGKPLAIYELWVATFRVDHEFSIELR